jgi:hypothetical protein
VRFLFVEASGSPETVAEVLRHVAGELAKGFAEAEREPNPLLAPEPRQAEGGRGEG